MVECLDGFVRNTSKELALTRSLKSDTPSRLDLLQDQEWLSVWEKCSYAHRQIDDHTSKRSRKNDDKSAVAMFKKNDWHRSIWQLVVNLDKGHDRSGRPDKNRATNHELRRLFYKTKSVCRFGEKCAFAHRQVDEQPTKRSRTNNDKNAVAMLKKGNWQERESVSDACHDRKGKPVKRSDQKLG